MCFAVFDHELPRNDRLKQLQVNCLRSAGSRIRTDFELAPLPLNESAITSSLNLTAVDELIGTWII